MTNRKGGNERGKGRDGGEISTKIFFRASIVYFPSTLPLDPESF